jgi:hypothetical protein
MIADALSRSPIWPASEDDDVDEDPHLINAIHSTTALNKELEIFCSAAQTDPSYQELITAIKQGRTFQSLPQGHTGRQYKGVWDHLSIISTEPSELVILDGTRIIVPEAIRADILQLLHSSHQGIVKTKQLA